ncbi:hypothetical protein HETIRDRAFT_428410 [Heterobasidion irregulare TC 32-1]|uniref:chorismate mutase n=1 Tax=Heterobasidion irregulare (strain TC 32-1) TaxID=747525 RepID=W4K337_HETIT|nr:uncharacterized protein HETIRDRAFT_428410 [Heterobasidion irregulare TC 32-1]ETW80149.1 hypothetical protein HETIRDRAFT_428410 [Heterobasidion irregulare TC 32-1]
MPSNESTHLSSENTLIEQTPSTDPSIPSTPEMSIVEERSVPWDTDEEQAAREAEEGFSEYLEGLDEDEQRQDEMIRLLTEDFDRPSPSHSPSPPPLIHTPSEGIVFPDRETYLTTPVAYMMGLIEGTPNTEFVSGPTRPEIQRALEILEEERSFVRHTQRALQIREGTLIARINAGERKLIGLDQTTPLRDTFHPTDDITPVTEYHMPTTAVVSRASSSASNRAPLRPMPGAYPMERGRGRDVYSPRMVGNEVGYHDVRTQGLSRHDSTVGSENDLSPDYTSRSCSTDTCILIENISLYTIKSFLRQNSRFLGSDNILLAILIISNYQILLGPGLGCRLKDFWQMSTIVEYLGRVFDGLKIRIAKILLKTGDIEVKVLIFVRVGSSYCTDPAIYADGDKRLLEFINARENASAASGRFDYGKLEYPFALSPIAPDSATKNDTLPPGRFHQDSFNGNANLISFYVGTLVPDFFQAPTSFFFHLDNSTLNDDAAMNLEAILLALLSHR